MIESALIASRFYEPSGYLVTCSIDFVGKGKLGTPQRKHQAATRKMIVMQILQLVALWFHLSQSCRLRYTRKELERKVARRGSRREGRSNNFNETSFSCDGRLEGGYYGDPEEGCQVFHVCINDGKGGLTKQSMSCPNGTLFQQKYFVCDWSFNVDCSTTEDFYELNLNRVRESRQQGSSVQVDECARGDPVTGRRKGFLEGASYVKGGAYLFNF